LNTGSIFPKAPPSASKTIPILKITNLEKVKEIEKKAKYYSKKNN